MAKCIYGMCTIAHASHVRRSVLIGTSRFSVGVWRKPDRRSWCNSSVDVQPPVPQNQEESGQRQPEPKRPRRTATGTGTNEHTLPIIVTMALWSLDDQYVITALSDFTIKVSMHLLLLVLLVFAVLTFLCNSLLGARSSRCGTQRQAPWCIHCEVTPTQFTCWTLIPSIHG
jgi:hypothetical protein